MHFFSDIVNTISIDWEYILSLSILIFLWLIEHFLIQKSIFKVPPITLHPFIYSMIRMLINFLAALFIIFISNREWLITIICLDSLLSVSLLAYYQYFQRPLSLFVAIRHIREGLKVFSFATRLLPWRTSLAFVGILGVKIFLAYSVTQNGPNQITQLGWLTWLFPLALLCLLVILLQFTSFRFECIRHATITRAIYVYGYSISWVADFFMASSIQKAAREEAISQTTTSNRLTATEAPWPVRRNVVIIQVESLCYNVLNCTMNDKEVTPFLNQLSRSSRVFKLQAYHEIGTIDMDYALLSGNQPSRHTVTYSIPDLDYTNALPHFMRQHGYRTMSLHGVTGEYYNRRANFERMGWDEICFREEFKAMQVNESYWGVRDQELLNYSIERFKEATKPEFHFIITLDSHGPFNLISENEKTIFPGSLNWKANYFNSMASVDSNISDYVSALPAGTLLILYGDHSAGVSYQGFTPARDHANEYVPCIVHICPGDGIDPLLTSSEESLPDNLNILDIVGHFRQQVIS